MGTVISGTVALKGVCKKLHVSDAPVVDDLVLIWVTPGEPREGFEGIRDLVD